MCVYRNDIYLFLENTTVRRLTVLPIYQLFTVLASRQKWSLLAEMLLMADQVNFRPAALKRVKRDLLFNIYQGSYNWKKSMTFHGVLSLEPTGISYSFKLRTSWRLIRMGYVNFPIFSKFIIECRCVYKTK